MTKADIIDDAIRRFPSLPIRTLSRYILYNHGPLFDSDLEKIRRSIRYKLGVSGEQNREVRKPPENRVVKMPETWLKKRTPYKLNPGLWLVINDLHIPFHSPKAIGATIEAAQAENVTGILLNGDVQDYASISFWPAFHKRDFDREVELVIDFFDFLEQELPNTEKIFKPGNHEFRLPRLYAAKVPEMLGLPLEAVNSVLGLEYRGIEMLDYQQIVMAGKLPIIHGNELQRIDRAVNPARGLFLKAKTWAACGHCHSTSQHTAKDLYGAILTTWSIGCLCDLEPDYNPFGNDWNWGFAIINVEKNGDFEVINRRILPNGKVV